MHTFLLPGVYCIFSLLLAMSQGVRIVDLKRSCA